MGGISRPSPDVATQGETFEELLSNLYEAVEGCLAVSVQKPRKTKREKVMEIVV